jgi:autotransporter-associated beta strand protein
VADATGSSAADLNVSAILRNSGNGTSGLTKNGLGTMVLQAVNEYTGTTTVRSGVLTVDASTGSLAAGSTMNFSGTGVYNYQAAAAGSTQTFNTALGLTTGDGTVRSTYGTSGNASVTFNSIGARGAGATLNLDLVGGTTTGATPTNKVSLTTAPTAGTLLDKGFYVGGKDFAAYSSSGYLRPYDYTADADAFTSAGGATLGVVAATSNVLLNGSVSNQTTAAINTLKINGNQNLALGSGQTLTVNGVLKTGNVAGGITISGGAGLQAAPGAELIFRTAEVNDAVTVSTGILANGTNALTKSGDGSVTLTGANSYTGATTVNGGTLTINGTSAYPGATTINGGTLNHLGAATFTGATTVNGGTLNQSPTATYSGGGAVNVTGGTLNMAGINTSTGATTITAGTLNIPVGGVSSGDGLLQLSGPTAQLTIAGSGTFSSVNLNGATVVTGTMNAASNTYFYVGSGGNNGGSAGSVGSLTIQPGAQMNISGSLATDNLVLGRDGGTGTVTQNGGNFDYNPSLAKDFLVSAGTGGLGIFSLNAGTFDVHAQNLAIGNYGGTGNFSLNGGTLRAVSVTSLGGGRGTFNFNGGILQAGANTGGLMGNIENARVQAGGAIVDTGTFNATMAESLSHDPALGATVDGGLRKRGTGNLTLTSGSSFTGATVVEAGTLTFAGGGSVLNSATTPVSVESGATLLFSRNDVFGIHSAAPLTPIILKQGATMTNSGALINVLGPLTFSGGTLTSTAGLNGDLPAWGLKANVTVNGATTSTISAGAGANSGIALGEVEVSSITFTVQDGAAPTDLLISAPMKNGITLTGAIQIPSTLVKMGAGTMSISGVNSYTGQTLLNEGVTVLTAPGNIATSSLTTVGAAGTLTGDGTAGALTISGRVAPGLGLGTLNSGAVTFADASKFTLEIGATTSDQLNAAGIATLNGSIALEISLLADPADLTSFTILKDTGLTGGGLFAYGSVLHEGDTFHVDSNTFSQDFKITYAGNGGTDVVLNAVPEPGTALTLLAGLGVLASARRRRSQS